MLARRQGCRNNNKSLQLLGCNLARIALEYLAIDIDTKTWRLGNCHGPVFLDDGRRNQILAEGMGRGIVFQNRLGWEHGVVADRECGDQLQRRRRLSDVAERLCTQPWEKAKGCVSGVCNA